MIGMLVASRARAKFSGVWPPNLNDDSNRLDPLAYIEHIFYR